MSFPTSCIILPHRIEDRAHRNVVAEISGDLFGGDEDEDDDDKEESGEDEGEEEEEEEQEEEEEEAPKKKGGRFRRMKGWFKKTCKVGKKLADGKPLEAGVECVKLAVSVTNKRFYLYLIDEVTGATTAFT